MGEEPMGQTLKLYLDWIKVAFQQILLRKWSDRLFLLGWWKPVLCQLNFLFTFWNYFSNIDFLSKEHLYRSSHWEMFCKKGILFLPCLHILGIVWLVLDKQIILTGNFFYSRVILPEMRTSLSSQEFSCFGGRNKFRIDALPKKSNINRTPQFGRSQ